MGALLLILVSLFLLFSFFFLLFEPFSDYQTKKPLLFSESALKDRLTGLKAAYFKSNVSVDSINGRSMLYQCILSMQITKN